jgi:hypothetical protein
MEEMIALAESRLLDQRLLQPGQTILVARWSASTARGWANFVKLHRLAGSNT